MPEHHMHCGPLAGQWVSVEEIPKPVLDSGNWPMRVGRFQGHYIRDELSAGGRDWDWEED